MAISPAGPGGPQQIPGGGQPTLRQLLNLMEYLIEGAAAAAGKGPQALEKFLKENAGKMKEITVAIEDRFPSSSPITGWADRAMVNWVDAESGDPNSPEFTQNMNLWSQNMNDLLGVLQKMTG